MHTHIETNTITPISENANSISDKRVNFPKVTLNSLNIIQSPRTEIKAISHINQSIVAGLSRNGDMPPDCLNINLNNNSTVNNSAVVPSGMQERTFTANI